MPESHDGETPFKLELHFSEEPGELSYRTVSGGLLYLEGATLTHARRLVGGSNLGWELTVRPTQDGDITIRLPLRSCGDTASVCAGGRSLAEGLRETVPGPDSESPTTNWANRPATGGAVIEGLPVVAQTLTADTSGIADDDGLTNATFNYQWLADDAGIEGATASTYTVAGEDVGKAIKVRVTFTDDAGSEESLISAATATVTQPLTAAIHDAPESHDGQSVFTFELRFSETPKDDLSYATLRDHAFTVTGGAVTNARRLEPGRNVRWEITVQPSGNDGVTVSLPATTDCTAQGAICTGDGSKLSSALELTVPGAGDQQESNDQQQQDQTSNENAGNQDTQEPLTASVHDAPDSHDGPTTFTFELRFSETPKDDFSYVTLRDHAFTVIGGAVTNARRLEPGKNVRWEIAVQPSGNDGVILSLPVTTDCEAQGAVCTGDGRMLSQRVELSVSGPSG